MRPDGKNFLDCEADIELFPAATGASLFDVLAFPRSESQLGIVNVRYCLIPKDNQAELLYVRVKIRPCDPYDNFQVGCNIVAPPWPLTTLWLQARLRRTCSHSKLHIVVLEGDFITYDQELYRTVEQTHVLRTGDCSAQFILCENAHDVLLNISRPHIKLHCVSPPLPTIFQSYALPIIFAL